MIHLRNSPVLILAFFRTPSRKSELFAIAATYTYTGLEKYKRKDRHSQQEQTDLRPLI